MNKLYWEKAEVDEEDIETYGKDCERWELWDFGDAGREGDGVVDTTYDRKEVDESPHTMWGER